MDWSGVDYLWIIVMYFSAVWTLILTAPIHCRASTGEQMMQCYISPNLMNKQTLHLAWPEGKSIYIFWRTIFTTVRSTCISETLTFCLHVVHRVGDDFVRVVHGSLPGQEDGWTGHGVRADVSGRARPVVRHHYDQTSHGQNRTLLILRLTLVYAVIFRNDLVNHQFTVKTNKSFSLWEKITSCFASKHWYANIAHKI